MHHAAVRVVGALCPERQESGQSVGPQSAERAGPRGPHGRLEGSANKEQTEGSFIGKAVRPQHHTVHNTTVEPASEDEETRTRINARFSLTSLDVLPPASAALAPDVAPSDPWHILTRVRTPQTCPQPLGYATFLLPHHHASCPPESPTRRGHQASEDPPATKRVDSLPHRPSARMEGDAFPQRSTYEAGRYLAIHLNDVED